MSIYIKGAFQELYAEDGLTIIARGLGMRKLLVKFLKLYSAHSDKKLVFCINLLGEENGILDMLLGDGLLKHELPKV